MRKEFLLQEVKREEALALGEELRVWLEGKKDDSRDLFGVKKGFGFWCPGEVRVRRMAFFPLGKKKTMQDTQQLYT